MISYGFNYHGFDEKSIVNPEREGTKLSRFNWVNIMAADALAPYVAKTSETVILTT